MTALIVALLGCLSTVSAGCAGAPPSPDSWHQIAVGGVDRNYLVHVPPGLDPNHAPAIVLSFHGGGGRPIGEAYITKMNPVADRHGFIVVYPEGTQRHWNDGWREGYPVDDVAFISALIDELKKTYHADPKRIYATGISNGAMFSQRLACQLSDKIASIAPVAGAMRTPIVAKCSPARPVSVLMINGKSDPLVPYDGGQVVGMRGPVLSAAAGVAFWVQHDGCRTNSSVSLPIVDKTDATRVHLELHRGCSGGNEVALYSIDNGGHTWPGGVQYLPASIVGLTSRQINADEVIWSFFARHPMP